MSNPITPEGATAYDAVRRVARRAAVAWLLLLLTLSLTPFDFDRGAAPRGAVDLVRRFSAAAPHLPDILANIALYAPFGALCVVAARRRGGSLPAAAAVALIAAGGVSLACESLQTMLPQRVCSIIDTTSNLIGASLGVLGGALVRAWLARASDALPRALRRAPLTLAWTLLASALLLVHLWPYDALTTPSRLWQRVRTAHVHPLHRWHALGAPLNVRIGATQTHAEANALVVRTRQDYALETAAEAAGYALLAGLSLLALRREYEFGRVASGLLSLWTCTFVGGLVTAGRMFLASREPDTLHLVAAVTGGLMGIAVTAGALSLRSPRAAAARAFAVTLFFAVLPALYVLAREATPLPWRSAAVIRPMPDWSKLHLLPLVGHAGSRADLVMTDLGAKFVRFGVFGAGLAWALRRGRRPVMTIIGITAAAGSIALAAQVLHLWMPARHSDLTNVLLAVIGAACGAVALLNARRYYLELMAHDDREAEAEAAAWDRKLVSAIIESKRTDPVTPDRVARRLERANGNSANNVASAPDGGRSAAP